MKRLYVSSDALLVGHLKAVLEQHRIACLVKNAFLQGAAGEIPPHECWPELWVEDEADFTRAQRLLQDTLEGDPSAEAWTCPACGEKIEPQFAQCWNCGGSANC